MLDTHKLFQVLILAGCKIVGVEIMEAAQAVQGHPFCGPTAFILGNEVSMSKRRLIHTLLIFSGAHHSAGSRAVREPNQSLRQLCLHPSVRLRDSLPECVCGGIYSAAPFRDLGRLSRAEQNCRQI